MAFRKMDREFVLAIEAAILTVVWVTTTIGSHPVYAMLGGVVGAVVISFKTLKFFIKYPIEGDTNAIR